MKRLSTIIILLFSCYLWVVAQQPTVMQEMQKLQTEHKVHFIYDASLNLNMPYKGEALSGLSLAKSLRNLFANTSITCERRGRNIILRAEEPPKSIMYQLHGRVTDSHGELLVNASVYDITSGRGVLTDEHGRFSLYLAAGNHQLRISYVGCEDYGQVLSLHADHTLNVSLSDTNVIDEVEVVGNLNSPVLTTQTGKRTLTANDIHTEFSCLSSPDLVKALQRMSGTTSGIELTSDLYVHGGNGDENLYLIDGTPLYHTNHTLGLFSSFNTDLIKTVDFYKSGFPARYSGRVSSIVDVRTNDGDMSHHHGSVSIGLLDGRLHFEGPIVKNKVSYNIGLRRSWMDLITRPIFKLAKVQRDDYTENTKFHYFFYDLNAKVTWRMNDRNTVWMSLYRGTDELKVESEYGKTDCYDDFSKMQWGKNNATLCWDSQLTPRLSLSTALVATHSTSLLHIQEDDYSMNDNEKHRNNLTEKRNTTGMYDAGIKVDGKYSPMLGHQVRFGTSMMHHGFRPQTKHQVIYYENNTGVTDTTTVESRVSVASNELTLYAEDEINLSRRFSLNVGGSYTMMIVKDKTYHLFDPRLSAKYQFAEKASLKASVTHMSQSIHRIASSLLSLPTDFWVPTTATFHPTTSWQFATGFYYEPSRHWTLSLEGFYKHSRHLLQYRNWMGLQPSAAQWDKDVIDGQGRSYGTEVDATYRNRRLTLNGSYTLSWSERQFDGFYDGWFLSQFDNRHKLDLSMRLKISKRISMTAAWNYHSGNRITLPVAYGYLPILPEGNNLIDTDFIYDKPNNYAMPAYHRLDLGFDFRRFTRKGKEHIWNLSIYNAYSHMNTMYVNLDLDYLDYKIKATKYGFFPIIPSISYTMKF